MPSVDTVGIPSTPAPLHLYPTDAAFRKVGLQLCSLGGERLATTLYTLLPAGEKTELPAARFRLILR